MITCSDSTFCVPAVYGLPRSKGLEIKRETLVDYSITSTARQDFLENGAAEVKRNRRYDFKVKFPVINKPGLKVAAGLRYFVEEYRFENIGSVEYPFYQNLEDKSLKNIGGALYFVKPMKGRLYIVVRVSAALSGDYKIDAIPKSDFLKFSVAPLVGWKKNPYTTYAFGVAYSNNFGKQSIYPLLVYNHTFNSRWGFESLLPLQVKLRFSPNRKNFMFFKTELNGASYNIRLEETPFNDFQSLHLKKSELRFLLSYEREIHDWLWFGLEAGMRSNLNFELAESNDPDALTFIDNKFNTAAVFNMSLFIVPPRKFLK